MCTVVTHRWCLCFDYMNVNVHVGVWPSVCISAPCSHWFTSHHLQHHVHVQYFAGCLAEKAEKRVNMMCVPHSLSSCCVLARFLMRSIMHHASVTVWQGRRWGLSTQIGLTVNKPIYSNRCAHPLVFVSPTALNHFIQVSLTDGSSQPAVPYDLG